MDNIISGLIAVAIFLAFALGLAASIKALPFALIAIAVCIMLLVDFFQSAKEGLNKEKNHKS